MMLFQIAVPGSGGCTPSPFKTSSTLVGGGNGQWWFDHLVWDIQAAWSLGLTPDVQISAGSGQGAPSYPDPYTGGSYAGTVYYNYSETTAGYDYDCGVSALMASVNDARAALGQGGRNVQWEAFNEVDVYGPDHANGGGYGGALGKTANWPSGPCGQMTMPNGSLNDCGGDIVVNNNGGNYLCLSSSFSDCGPMEAAELWQEAELYATSYANYQLAALTATTPQTGYNGHYLSQMNGLYLCSQHYYWCYGEYPRWWAIHDYLDPTAGALGVITTADLQAFDNLLSAGALQSARVWVTESGVHLEDATTHDNNWNVVTCSGDDSDDPNNTFGCLADDDSTRQANGALTWKALGTVTAANVITSEVYWYEFTAIGHWDSALVDQAFDHTSAYGYGIPRGSFCELVGENLGTCAGNPDEYLSPNSFARDRASHRGSARGWRAARRRASVPLEKMQAGHMFDARRHGKYRRF